MKNKPIYISPVGKSEIMALYDTVLARWPVDHETFYLPTRHGETFIIASGEKTAPGLVLIHGSASNAVSWVGDVAEYSRYFRVYAVDLPGEPGRSSENRPSWNRLDFAEWLEDVLDDLNVMKTSILGVSQGGWTALRFATCHPERVSSLVLLASGGVVQTRLSFILSATILSMLGRWGEQRFNRLIFGKQPVHAEAIKFIDAIHRNFNARIEKEYLFSDDELKRLNMPTFFVGGDQDILFDVEEAAKRLSKLVPRLKVEIIPDMGHGLINLSSRILPFLLSKEDQPVTGKT